MFANAFPGTICNYYWPLEGPVLSASSQSRPDQTSSEEFDAELVNVMSVLLRVGGGPRNIRWHGRGRRSPPNGHQPFGNIILELLLSQEGAIHVYGHREGSLRWCHERGYRVDMERQEEVISGNP